MGDYSEGNPKHEACDRSGLSGASCLLGAGDGQACGLQPFSQTCTRGSRNLTLLADPDCAQEACAEAVTYNLT